MCVRISINTIYIFDFNCMFVSCSSISLALALSLPLPLLSGENGGLGKLARQRPRRLLSLIPDGVWSLFTGHKQKYSDRNRGFAHLADFPYGNKCNISCFFVFILFLSCCHDHLLLFLMSRLLPSINYKTFLAAFSIYM